MDNFYLSYLTFSEAFSHQNQQRQVSSARVKSQNLERLIYIIAGSFTDKEGKHSLLNYSPGLLCLTHSWRVFGKLWPYNHLVTI